MNIIFKNLRPLNLTVVFAILLAIAPNSSFAWVWPWEGEGLQAQIDFANSKVSAAESKASTLTVLLALSVIVSASVIAGILFFRNAKEGAHHIKPTKTETPKATAKPTVVVDGLNVIFSSYGRVGPSLLRLLGMLLELEKNGFDFKCYFDSSTYWVLFTKGHLVEAKFFNRLCRTFPSKFVVVPGGSKADDYLLEFANRYNCRVISNDRFRDYFDKFSWLTNPGIRLNSFVTQKTCIEIPGLQIEAPIPQSIDIAAVALNVAKPPPRKAALPKGVRQKNWSKRNGVLVLRPASN